MNPLPGRQGWAIGLLALGLSITVAVVAYSVGVSHGLTQIAAGAGNATPPPYAYGWHRPWGIWPVFSLLFFFFWAVVARAFWWGWGPRWYWYRGYRSDDRERFDEWHRRAHDQMSK